MAIKQAPGVSAPDGSLYITLTDGAGNLVSAGGGGAGTVTSVSVTSANGLAGTVATATTTPAITLSTSVTGILSGNGTAISAATTTGTGSVVLSTSPALTTPTLGIASGTSLALGGATIGSNALAVTGTSALGDTTGTSFTATGLLQAGTTLGISTDVLLNRDAANTLAQRNGTAAQTLRIYNTWTDASNYELATFNWSTVANRLTIGPAALGTGTLRSIGFTSHVLWNTDNTYDIGASGATRPRSGYFGTDVIAGGTITAGGSISGTSHVATAGSAFLWTGRSRLASPVNGNILLSNSAIDNFGILQFGGTTSSFPALKRSGATLIVTGADDSAIGGITANGPLAGIGYSTGAGGTVTQATSRTTGVTLNKVSGQITTTADAIAAITIVTFTVTNSAVAATDTIILSKVSGDIDTSAWISNVAAGSFNISLRNNAAVGDDVTAFVVNFNVIKGVTS